MRISAREKRWRIGSIQPSPCSSPKATADCRFGAVEKVRNWWARAATAAFSGDATIQPTFQPVSEKILPAEPAFSVRSAIPGRDREWREALAMEQDMLPHLVADDGQVMRDRDVGDDLKLVLPVQPARRILRIVEDDRPGPVAQRGLERFPVDAPERRLQSDFARRRPCPSDHRRITVVGRREDDHLVAWLDRREDHRPQCFGRSARHANMVRDRAAARNADR